MLVGPLEVVVVLASVVVVDECVVLSDCVLDTVVVVLLDDDGTPRRYKFKRSPAPHFFVVSPGQSKLQSDKGVLVLAGLRVFPQKHSWPYSIP